MDKTVREYVGANFSFIKAGIFVLNDKGQLLVLRRSEWKKIPGQDYRPDLSHKPDIPGGVIGDTVEKESGVEGAVRELAEETGIIVDPSELELVYTETNYNERGHHSKNTLIYMVKLDHTPDVKISWEHEYFSWRDIREVASTNYLQSETVCHRAIHYILEHPNVFGV